MWVKVGELATEGWERMFTGTCRLGLGSAATVSVFLHSPEELQLFKDGGELRAHE